MAKNFVKLQPYELTEEQKDAAFVYLSEQLGADISNIPRDSIKALYIPGPSVRCIYFEYVDYPGVIFNSGNGIVATNGKQYEVDSRRCHGIGLGIGPSLGIFYDNPTQSLKPAIGVTITIGYTYTPRRFQW